MVLDEETDMERKITKKVKVGSLVIGGNSPVTVQSMTNTDTRDVQATARQIHQLEEAGCDIVRLAIFDEDCIKSIKEIKSKTEIPLVADIHFDYKLAVDSIKEGIDKLRINPGNIGSEKGVREIVAAAKERLIPIRIGVNSGSIKKEFLHKYGNTPKAMVESALEQISILEKFGYEEIVISLKASNVNKTVEAYRFISKLIDYPLHLGVTEAGTSWSGTIKSSIGIGALLLEGIGDTLRVSLTADPVQEVRVGKEILKVLGLQKDSIEIISCPTCGRCNINLEKIVNEVESQIQDIKVPITIAVMGCVVNGPGEAKVADIGIAGGKGRVVLFKKGKTIGTYPQEEAVSRLISEIRRMTDNNESSCYNTSI